MAEQAAVGREVMKEDPGLSRDALLQRQRQEVKDLRAKIQSMKKSVPKGDKKRKKEITGEITRLEQELQEKHEQEIKSMDDDRETIACEGVEGGEGEEGRGEGGEGLEVGDEEKPVKKSRAQKRKEKKAQEELERQQMRDEEDKEMSLIDNPQLREREGLETMLDILQLVIIDIQPDGDCLYAAIKDQLWQRLNIESSVAKLRAQCAEYIREHSEDFLPFSTDPNTGDLCTNEQFVQYCLDIETTASWGGQLEIRALSHVYHVTITVYQAESPPLVVGEEYYSDTQSTLTLSYHRHEYGLGEHYNSLTPITR